MIREEFVANVAEEPARTRRSECLPSCRVWRSSLVCTSPFLPLAARGRETLAMFSLFISDLRTRMPATKTGQIVFLLLNQKGIAEVRTFVRAKWTHEELGG